MNAAAQDDSACWDAFGDNDESDDGSHDEAEKENLVYCEAGVLCLKLFFLRHDAQIPLEKRRVCCICASKEDGWKRHLEQQLSVQLVSHNELCDAAILDIECNENNNEQLLQAARRNIVPGGLLLLMATESKEHDDSGIQRQLDKRVWNIRNVQTVHSSSQRKLLAIHKHACPINEVSCVWARSSQHTSTTHAHDEEERSLLEQATVTRSAHEIINKLALSPHKLQQASTILTKHGYCVVRDLLNVEKCKIWGSAVLEDFEQACRILKERDGVDLRNPQSSQQDPQNYQEMAMREDLRMDLRDGPRLRELREKEASHFDEWNIIQQQQVTTNTNDGAASKCTPVITTSPGSHDSCLRFHADILEIIRRTMNPRDDLLYKGNLGRYNFDGSGPDGSYPPLRIGPVGGIVSLPGSADQALHADTPHLFEHVDCLPAHYVNVFALGADVGVERDDDGSSTGATSVGGTAFVHGSHRLSMTAQMANDVDSEDDSMLSASGREIMLRHLVRPSLQVGDVVFFDCRILHFGLANNSHDTERPMLYVNMTHAFFHDPKNWDDRKSIFHFA